SGVVVPAGILARLRLNPELIFRHAVSLLMALVTGLLAVQLFELFRREGLSPRASVAWSLLIALSPPLLSHAFLFFTEIPSALLVLWLFRSLSDDRPPRHWPLIGAAIGLLLLIHVRNIAFVALFFVWAGWRLWQEGRRRDFVACAAAALIPVAIRSAAM